MDLRNFVAQTIASIVKGVVDARDLVGDDAIINPVSGHFAANEDIGTFTGTTESDPKSRWKFANQVHKVSFDVALEAQKGADTDSTGKLDLKVASISLGAEGHYKEGHISRVRFVVPIVLPGDQRGLVEQRSEPTADRANRPAPGDDK